MAVDVLELLQLLLVPACFVLAGLLGHRLGTPATVAAAVCGVGVCHLAGIGVAHVATRIDGAASAPLHLGSAVLFFLGFVSLVWVTRAFPHGRAPGVLERTLVGVAVVAPAVGALAGRTPSVDADARPEPLAELLPGALQRVPDLCLMGVALLAVATYAVRFARSSPQVRPMMWWPLFGVLAVGLLAAVGTAMGPRFPGVASLAFLVAAPVLPLTLALGPVRRRLLALVDRNDRLEADLAARVAELEESRRRLSVAADEERRRIERDLHDGVQQELLALIARIEIARARSADAELDRAAELARGAYETVRRVSHGIRPAVLDDLGLEGAVRAAVESLPLEVRLTVHGVTGRRFAPAVESAALFFVSEALANVLKHSEAAAVRVDLAAAEEGLVVGVADDGKGGVDPAGAGVRGLCDRVEAVGGSVVIDTRPGRSRLTARFP